MSGRQRLLASVKCAERVLQRCKPAGAALQVQLTREQGKEAYDQTAAPVFKWNPNACSATLQHVMCTPMGKATRIQPGMILALWYDSA